MSKPPNESGPAPLAQGDRAGDDESALPSIVCSPVNSGSGWDGLHGVPIVDFDFGAVEDAVGVLMEAIPNARLARSQAAEVLRYVNSMTDSRRAMPELSKFLAVIDAEAYRGRHRDPIRGLRAACAVLYLLRLPFCQGLGVRWFALVLGVSPETFSQIVVRMREATGIKDSRERSTTHRLKLQFAAYRRKKKKVAA